MMCNASIYQEDTKEQDLFSITLEEAQAIDRSGIDHRCNTQGLEEGPKRSLCVPMSCAEAWEKSQDMGCDLVVEFIDEHRAFTHIMSLSSWEYHMSKKKRAEKSQQRRKSRKKVVKINTNISDHDLDNKVRKIVDFAQSGHPVEVAFYISERNISDKFTEGIRSKIVQSVPGAHISLRHKKMYIN